MAEIAVEDKTYVESELLAYLFTYIDRASADYIQKTLVQFYTPEEISNAKDALWNAYHDHISTPLVNRRGAKESAASKEAVDIIKACQQLDRKQVISESIIFTPLRSQGGSG